MDSLKLTPRFLDIIEAQETLKPVIKITPVEPSRIFSTMFGADVFLKLENLQSTGSFKVRGAYNKLAHLHPDDLKNGVTA